MREAALSAARLAWEDVRFWAVETGALAREIGSMCSGAARAVWGARAVALHTASIVGGWALLTAGVAELLVPEVWLVSGGLFLLSLAGWSHLRVVFSHGLYSLTRKKP